MPTSALSRQGTHPWRYVAPAVLAALAFVVLPMVFTIFIGFTNRSSTNLLDFDRVVAQLSEASVAVEGSERPFALVPRQVSGKTVSHVVVLGAGGAGASRDAWITAEPIDDALRAERRDVPSVRVPMVRARADHSPWIDEAHRRVASPEATLPDVLDAMPFLQGAAFETHDRTKTLRVRSLRDVAERRSLYERSGDQADGAAVAFTDRLTGQRYTAHHDSGFFVSADGDRLQPGFQVNVGGAHYKRLVTDDKFRAPFVGVLLWTMVFSALSVVGAAALGMLLASLLNWDRLRGANVYRVILFLPYAVPGFLSILIFKGLFNQNLGEVNLILDALFGIKPAWFSDPWLARLMLVIVNVWLGFPYMMIICTGLLQSIPTDLREASAEAGAGPITHFRRIVLPLIIKPMLPLLVAAFAFNFNNFVLVSLLTQGRPDVADATLPVGMTDILATYTWRIAFNDSGQQYGLAAAISTVIFLIVAIITLVQLKLSRAIDAESPRRAT